MSELKPITIEVKFSEASLDAVAELFIEALQKNTKGIRDQVVAIANTEWPHKRPE